MPFIEIEVKNLKRGDQFWRSYTWIKKVVQAHGLPKHVMLDLSDDRTVLVQKEGKVKIHARDVETPDNAA